MIENRTFNSNLENSIRKFVNDLSNEDFQKYLFAKGNEIIASEFYEEILTNLYLEEGSSILEYPYSKFIKIFDHKSSIYTTALSQIIDNSVYVSKNFQLDIVAADDVLGSIILKEIDRLDLDAFVNNFVCSDKSSAKLCIESILKSSEFINVFISILRRGGKTETISYEFFKIFKDKINTLAEPLKTESGLWYETFFGKKNVYDLFNNLIKKMTSILDINDTVKLDSASFNAGRINFYNIQFNSSMIKNLNYYTFSTSVKEQLVKEIIELTYSSASKKSKYVKYDTQRVIVCDNTHIIPMSVFEKVLNMLPNTINQAMFNYYMFLFGSEVVFSDADGKKYSFPIDNVHILGLKNNEEDFYKYFKNNPVTNNDLVSPKFTGSYIFNGGISADVDTQVSTLVSTLQSDNDLKCKISALNNIQGIVTKLMTTDEYSQKIDLLVYFYNKKYKVNDIKNNTLSKIFGSNSSALLEILDEYPYYFGSSFISLFKNDERDSVLHDFVDRYNSSREEVVKKFDSIFSLQEYLTYLYSLLTNEVLKLRNSNGRADDGIWKKYFSDHILNRKISYSNTSTTLITNSGDYNSSLGTIKLDKIDDKYVLRCDCDGVLEDICSFKINSEKNIVVSDINSDFDVVYNDKKRLKVSRKNKYDEYLNIITDEKNISMEYTNKTLSVFSLANAYVHAQKDNFSNKLSDASIGAFSSIINILKIYDKFLYMNHFNFSIDITNLFLTDLQADKLPGIICEMLVLDSSLFTLYDYVDSSGKTHFVSTQDAESLVTVKSNISLLPDIINFKSKEYKTILGFCERRNGEFSNILTQTHSDFKKKKYGFKRILNMLKDKNLILRYSTSSSIVGNYGNVDEINEVLSNAENLDFIDLLKRNLIGCSNALLWLETLNYDNFKNFVGLSSATLMDTVVDFFNIRVLLYKNILDNISLLVEKIDDELEYKDMLDYLDQYRNTGNSVLLSLLKAYLTNKLGNTKEYSEIELDNLTSVNEKADYLESKLNILPNGFLLDSQVNECILIKNMFVDYLNRYDISIIEKVVAADVNNSDSFKFIEDMGNNEIVFNQFIEDLKLRYPASFIICLYNKLSTCYTLTGKYALMVRQVLSDRIDKNNSVSILNYVTDIINKKDEDYPFMVFLEAKIDSYIEYIKEVEEVETLDFDKIILLYSELLKIIEQKFSLLSKKYLDYEKMNNKRGLIANVKKFVDSPEARQMKIENEVVKLGKKRNKFNDILKLYVNLNTFMNFNSSNIDINVIDNLFSLGSVYGIISSNMKETIKNKISELLSDNNLDFSLVSALNVFNLRIDSETELAKYFGNIDSKLNNKTEQLIRYKDKMFGNSLYKSGFIEIYERHLSKLQIKLDDEVLSLVSSMYQYISVVFKDYPDSKIAYFKNLEVRIKELYERQSEFKYKDLITLIIDNVGRSLQSGINKIHVGVSIRLNEILDTIASAEEIFEFLSSTLYSELEQIESIYSRACDMTNSYLENNHYIKEDGVEQRIRDELLQVKSNEQLIDTYIDCVINSLNKKVSILLNDYRGYAPGTEYNYSSLSAEFTMRQGVYDSVNSLVSSNLIALYKFLLMKKKDGTPLIEDENKIVEYRKKIKDRVITILNKKSIASLSLINLINSEELESTSIGKK